MRDTVLVVDDNPDFLRAVRAVLERESFAVHTVQTGRQAIAFLEHRTPFVGAPRPAFVVLDYRLDDMNAPAVLTQLRRRPDLRGIPVLVVSQTRWDEDEAAALAAGAHAFREKPSRMRALRDCVVSFWEDHVHGAKGPADRG